PCHYRIIDSPQPTHCPDHEIIWIRRQRVVIHSHSFPSLRRPKKSYTQLGRGKVIAAMQQKEYLTFPGLNERIGYSLFIQEGASLEGRRVGANGERPVKHVHSQRDGYRNQNDGYQRPDTVPPEMPQRMASASD